MNWNQELIGSCLGKVSNVNPALQYNENVFPYVDISSVSTTDKMIVACQNIKGVDAPSRARQLIQHRDVLVSTVRPNLNAVAFVSEQFDHTVASTGFCVLRPDITKLSPRYLYYWVRSPLFINDMVKKATGASYPAVSDTIIKASKIPLPPLHVQEQIANTLDKADALRRKDQELLQKYDKLAPAIFHDMFGDPQNNPKNFPRKKLDEIVDFIGGSQPPKSTFKYEPTPGYIRLIQIRDYKSDRFLTYVPEGSTKKLCNKEDIMIGRYGPPVFQILRGLAGAYNVALMKAIPTNVIQKEYLFFLLSSRYVQDIIISNSQRTAGQTGVNLELLNNIEVSVPPITLQEKFTRQVNLVIAQRNITARNSLTTHDLFSVLLNQSYT
jgi:type I restriction enzyme S subunit